MNTFLNKMMCMLGVVSACAVATAGFAQESPAPGDKGFSRYVLKKIDDQYRGQSSEGEMEMTIRTRHWTRTLVLKSWSLGEEYSLVKILSPRKEKGTATLKAGKTLFTYLNKTGRTIKINGAMMGSAWMGSHFTNDDLVQENRLSDDFTHALSFQGKQDGQLVYTFTCVPKPKVPIVYGKVEITVLQESLQPLSRVFYDEDGEAVRKMVYSDFRTAGDRVIPHRMKMMPLDKKGEYTEIRWRSIDFNSRLKKSFFSIHNLRSI